MELALRLKETDAQFDIDLSGTVEASDGESFIDHVLRTYRGDSNLDGQFDSGDLVQVFVSGGYEDAIEDNSTWASGDWDFDGDFTTSDLTVAFQSGGYQTGPRPSATAIPEPSLFALAIGTVPLLGPRLRIASNAKLQ